MKYEITNEQIESLRCVMNISSCENGISFLKEWFPEAFKKQLPKDFTGWCKIDIVDNEKWLVYSEKGNLKYGTGSDGIWFESSENLPILNHYREATESEVFEALKNEAVRRGYKNGNFKCLLMPDFTHEVMNNFHFQDNMLFHGESNVHKNNVIFKDGQWAEIIETITKEEAEKLLNKKII